LHLLSPRRLGQQRPEREAPCHEGETTLTPLKQSEEHLEGEEEAVAEEEETEKKPERKPLEYKVPEVNLQTVEHRTSHIEPTLNLNSLCAMRQIRPGHLSFTFVSLELHGVNLALTLKAEAKISLHPHATGFSRESALLQCRNEFLCVEFNAKKLFASLLYGTYLQQLSTLFSHSCHLIKKA
jgi:hypothetical protein